MIIAPQFRGDDDLATMREQHDVYGVSLGITVAICRDHASFAVAVLGGRWPSGWQIIDQVDHRTLQQAHDLLAAAWRFRTGSGQLTLPFESGAATPEGRMEAWQSWLRTELQDWRHEPRLIHLTMTILANQNRAAGYDAEDALDGALRRRFIDVPWLPGRLTSAPGLFDDAPAGEEEEVETSELDSEPGLGGSLTNCECVKAGRRACGQVPCKTLCARAIREGWGPLM